MAPDSPAAEAELREGDVIIEWNRQAVDDIESLTRALAEHEPGDEVHLLVQREGERIVVPVTLGSR